MKHLVQFDNFLNESKINVAEEVDQEIQTLMEALLKNEECEMFDDGYIEIQTPFETNPESKNPEWKNKVGMVFFPELLTYESREESNKVQRTPWISCRISLEGERDESKDGELLKWLVSLIEKSGYKPFMDEDARVNHWREEKKKGYTEYTCFVNPDYPEGHWENHALE
jgi:hypothetical protein